MNHLQRIQGPAFVPGLRPGVDSQPHVLEIEDGRLRSVTPHVPSPETELPCLLRTKNHGEIPVPGPFVCLPAFVDGHTHLVGVGLGTARPRLSAARSKDAVLSLLEAWLVAHPGDSPVLAEGWDQSQWDPPSLLLGADLDRLGSPRPIAARRVCGHVAAFNQAALASFREEWPGLDRAEGTATEELPLALTRIWLPSEEQYDAAVDYGQREALRHGIGWVHEMGDLFTWQALRRAEARGALLIRVSHFFRCEGRGARADLIRFAQRGLGSERSEEFRDSEHLRFAGIKLFLDGSIGARTAAVREPYPGAGGHGRLVWEDGGLREALEICRDQDWPVAVHAIGDAAAEQLLRVLEQVGVPGGIGPRIEHAEMFPSDLQERASRLGAFLSMQPNFTDNWQGPGGLYEQVLGPDRARALNPYVDAYRTGRLLFGSDTMPLGPARGLRGALRHPDPAQRLDLSSALHSYGAGAAAATRSPFHQARIAEGEPADLVIVAPGESGWGGTADASVPVLATVLGGTVRFERNGAVR